MAKSLVMLHALQRGSPQIQSWKIQLINFTLDYGTRDLYGQDIDIPLTNEEFQLLECFLNILIKLLPVTRLSINFGNYEKNLSVM